MRRPLWIPWRWWRRAIQFALLVVFLWLFRRTESTGADFLSGGENIFFRMDPLVGAAAMLGARQFIAGFWPALLIVGLTMLLGRFFCGWVCPLGTLLDYFGVVVRIVKSPYLLWIRGRSNATAKQDGQASACVSLDPSTAGVTKASPTGSLVRFGRGTRYVVLGAVLVAAVFAFPLAGLLDPFSLLVRAMTFWGDPAFFRNVDAAIGTGSEGWAVETLQPFLRKYHVLPFREGLFRLAGVSAALLAIVFALEFVVRRFWCRYLCPAGTLFGLFARGSLLKRVPGGVCKTCSHCAAVCRMNAIEPGVGTLPEACTLCMDCVDFCPTGISRFRFASTRKKKPSAVASRPTDLSRRSVLAGIVAGAAIPGASLAAGLGCTRSIPATLLRPPGADDEQTFLNLCVRCGECMKVCPTNVLQPTIFEAGLEGMFSPHMVPRLIFEQSYCEFACTLCGQVCPTGAIPRLTEEEKHARPTGIAYFDHSLCLPWAEKTACIRCEEMCPAPEKAIKILNTFKTTDKDGMEVEIQQPYVDHDLCVGCGICESNCTIPGVAGIRLQRRDAPDPGTEFLLKSTLESRKASETHQGDPKAETPAASPYGS